MNKRTLSLKREALVDLTDADLRDLAGGTKETLYSCMTFISCYIDQCLISRYGVICLEG